MLFTHFGISGPLAFRLSSHTAWRDISGLSVYLSPVSDFFKDDWNQFLQKYFQNHPKKILTSALKEKIPAKLANVIIDAYFSEFSNTFLSQISKETRQSLADLLGNGIPITLKDRRP